MKHLIIAVAIFAAVASTAHADPGTGRWKWSPACYLIGRVPATFTTNIALCKQYQRPIFYVWVWKP